MSNKLSIAIMAHPSRAKYIPYLLERLGDVPVIYDRKNDIWDTCRRAWLAIDKAAEYGLVVQDDAIVCSNFRERAEACLDGDFVYSFFAGYLLRDRIRHAEAKGRGYVESGQIFNEIAICMRTKHIDRMVKFCDDMQAKTDQDISKWARLRRLKVRYPIPSLIDHRDEESLYQKNYNRPGYSRPRKAVRYADA